MERKITNEIFLILQSFILKFNVEQMENLLELPSEHSPEKKLSQDFHNRFHKTMTQSAKMQKSTVES